MKLMQDRRKKSIYVPETMLVELEFEAARCARSVSWILRYAWDHGGYDAVKGLSSVDKDLADDR